MNRHRSAHKAKARHLCFLLLLSFHLVWGGVPGPCRHSVTKDHLSQLNRLIDNQLENGCPISYLFTEHQSLSKVCYIKAAFPQILELLNAHFQYGRRSDNRRYVNALKKVIYDIYSQRCIYEINEELEENPVRFHRVQKTSSKEALRKVKQVMQMYMSLMKENAGPVAWNCDEEYAGDYPDSTTALPILTTGGPACLCSCPTLAQMTQDVAVLSTSVWSSPPQTTLPVPVSNISPRPPHTSQSTKSEDAWVSLVSPGVGGHASPGGRLRILDRRPTDGDNAPQTEMLRPHQVTGVKYDSSKDKFLVSGINNNVTPTPFLYDVVAPSSDDSTLYVLAKRSLDARNYAVQQASQTDSFLTQVSKPYPQAKDTGVRYLDNLDYQNHQIGSVTTEEGPFLKKARRHSTELKITPEVQSIKEAEDTDAASLLRRSAGFQNKEAHRSERSPSYQTVFIIAAVCVGLLLMTTLRCFRAKRRLQVLLQPSSFQNHRAHINTNGIELQCFETKE